MRVWLAVVAALSLTAVACSDKDSVAAAGGSSATGGQGGQGAGGGQGGGVQAGAQLICPPGELSDGEGGCVPPGVPDGSCGQGFDSDGEGGCVAVLPDSPCASGMMALPGEDSCRAVAPCGAGTWGDIPIDGTTLFVDQSYGAGNNDGTQAHPWTTVQAALTAAPAGARIAIAAGDYLEDPVLSTPVVLWGKCPAEVTLGSSNSTAAVTVTVGGSGSEIRGLAISGTGAGVTVSDADVLVDSVWIHDTGGHGFDLSGGSAVGSATVQNSLIERATAVGLRAWAADLTMQDTVVRDTQPIPSGEHGHGVLVVATAGPASLVTRHCVVAHNRRFGIFSQGATVRVEDTLVTDTMPQQLDLGDGVGIDGQRDSSSGRPTQLTLSGSVVEGSHRCGVCLGASALSMDRTVVRDTSSEVSDEGTGYGVRVHGMESAERPYVDIRTSTIDGAYLGGLTLLGVEATIESTVVRNVEPRASDLSRGRAITVAPSDESGLPSSATIRGVLAERAHETGIFVLGSDADIEATWVRDIEPRASDHTIGAGIAYTLAYPSLARASGAVRQIVIEDVHAVGFAVAGADVTASDVVVRRCQPQPSGDFGDGLIASSYLVLFPGVFSSSLEIERATVVDSARAGIASFGADIALGSSLLECNAIHLNGESVEGAIYAFEDRGGNACGCGGAEEDCHVLSSGLELPLPPF